jgi:subtilisin family serine protease
MFDCTGLSQQDRLKSLVAGPDALVAVFPPDVLDYPTPPEPPGQAAAFYFYRPRQLLVRQDYVELFLALAREVFPGQEPIDISQVYYGPDVSGTVRFLSDLTLRDGDDQQQFSSPGNDTYAQLPAEAPVGVKLFEVPTDRVIDDVITEFELRSDGRLMGRLTPNHVVFACQTWHLTPCGDPSPPPAATPPTEISGGNGIVVAVADSGLPPGYGANPLLAANVLPPQGFEPFTYAALPTAPALRYPDGHGTFVAGVVHQFAKDAVVGSYRVLNSAGVTDEWALANQLAKVLEEHPRVINLSLGTFSRKDFNLLGFTQLGEHTDGGAGDVAPVVVAAAGNSDLNRPFWPAAEHWAISVGAAEHLFDGGWKKACFSNYGCWVKVCADGVGVHSSYPSRKYLNSYPPNAGATVDFVNWALWSGTSFATPHVSGVIARLLAQPGTSAMGYQAIFHTLKAASPGQVAHIGWLVP